MRELRPQLKSADEFVGKVLQQQRAGFELALLEVDGEVTGAAFRSKGHGKTMLDWLIALARERGCEMFSLDSGTHRQEAHAFYFREGMRVSSFHFALPLK